MGIYRCDCPRFYSDLQATWGWDSYREIYVYGRSLYEIIASDSPYDLPIFLKIAQAQRHDSVLSVVSLHEARKLYEDWHFHTFIADSAHDAYPIYTLLNHWDTSAIIPLNPRNESHLTYDPYLNLTENGTPICKNGSQMAYYGYCQDRSRLKWRCPKVLGKIADCKYFNCSNSPYGRVIYTKSDSDLRLFTRVPRESKLWKKKYATRSGCERSNKRKKIDYIIEKTQVRSDRQWFVRVMLVAMCQHIDAWYQEAKIGIPSFINDLLKE